MSSKKTPMSAPVDAVVMQSVAGLVEMAKGDAGGLVPFTVGELFGPCRCVHDGCKNEAWSIWMTAEEYNEAKTQDGVHPVDHVFSKGIGQPLCDDHRPTGSA